MKKTDLDLLNLGIYDKEVATEEEENNPNYFEESGYKYLLKKHNLSKEDIDLQLKILQVKNTKSIKYMMIFFTVLTIINLCVSISLYLLIDRF